jgi:hypothetical protein
MMMAGCCHALRMARLAILPALRSVVVSIKLWARTSAALTQRIAEKVSSREKVPAAAAVAGTCLRS